MNPSPDPEALARQRFLVLGALRWSGVAIAFVGIAVLAGKIALDPLVGYVLLVVGALDALIMPLVLARAWKSPPR